MKWLTGIIIFFGALLIILTADFFLGRHFYRKSSRQGSYPIRRGQLQLITNGADLFSQYFDDLYKANSSIHVLFYIVKDDRFSSLFFEILMEQAKKGVKVRLLVDWLGSRKIPKNLIEKARMNGVELMFCHRPRFPFIFFSLQQRNHRKITIIDGKVGYVGGFNVGKEYIDLDPVLSPWRDYHMRITGEGIADLQREFLLDWEQAGGINLLKETYLFPELQEGPISYRFFPTKGIGAEEKMIQLIEDAKQSIFIGTPYFIPPKGIIYALEKALQKGIDVSILAPNQSDHPLVKEASFRFLRRILAHGGTVYHYESGFFHAKVILIDDSFCDIGTANFDCRSLLLNYEINCFIYDRTFIQEVYRSIQKDISQSRQVSYEKLANLPLSVQIKEWTGALFKGLL